jgi:hypothetical protein
MNAPSKPDKTGELKIDLLGSIWSARITFRAIRGIERELDLSLRLLTQRIMSKDLRVEDFAVVFHHAILGGGATLAEAPSVEDIGDILMRKKLDHWLVEYGNLVIGAVTAGAAKRIELSSQEKAPGEAKPQTNSATSGEPTGQAPSATLESSPTKLGT